MSATGFQRRRRELAKYRARMNVENIEKKKEEKNRAEKEKVVIDKIDDKNEILEKEVKTKKRKKKEEKNRAEKEI